MYNIRHIPTGLLHATKFYSKEDIEECFETYTHVVINKLFYFFCTIEDYGDGGAYLGKLVEVNKQDYEVIEV